MVSRTLRVSALLASLAMPGLAGDILPAGKTPWTRGAVVPWITYEAELGTPKGGASIIGPGRRLGTADGEASGRRAVMLTATGASVEWTAVTPANALVLRVSIPDAAGGGGQSHTLGLYVNGVRKASLKVTSAHAWLYGDDNTQGDTPGAGTRKIYDETQLLLSGFAIAVGDVVMLRKDAEDQAAHYAVDFIELENAPAPLAKPAGYISILDHGAVANDGGNDDEAIRKAVAAVQAGQGAGVFIPAGLFLQGAKIRTRNVKIQGAGIWHSKLYCPNRSEEPDGGYTGFVIEGDGSEFRDFAVFGWGGTRNQGGKAFMGSAYKNTVIERMWVEHVECGFWVGGRSESTGLLIKDSRFRNTGADAVNLCNGNLNGVIDNCHARHTGDDAFAIWSARDLYGQPCVNNVIRNSTAQLPWRAACFAIYGGRGNRIENCQGIDALTYPGLTLSSDFNPYPMESATVDGLTLVRCGGQYYNPPQPFGAVWIYSIGQAYNNVTVRNLTISEPTFSGIHFQSAGMAMGGVLVENVSVIRPATYGIQIKAESLGSATLKNISVGTASPSQVLVNQSPSFKVTQEGVGQVSGLRRPMMLMSRGGTLSLEGSLHDAQGRLQDRYSTEATSAAFLPLFPSRP